MSNQDLKDQVLHIRNQIESGEYETEEECSGYDYLSDVYNITYYVDGDKIYQGARVMVACGGPNIFIDTYRKSVEGYWWGDNYSTTYMTDSLNLDQALEEIYDC